jgi:hypothetical protein
MRLESEFAIGSEYVNGFDDAVLDICNQITERLSQDFPIV